MCHLFLQGWINNGSEQIWLNFTINSSDKLIQLHTKLSQGRIQSCICCEIWSSLFLSPRTFGVPYSWVLVAYPFSSGANQVIKLCCVVDCSSFPQVQFCLIRKLLPFKDSQLKVISASWLHQQGRTSAGRNASSVSPLSLKWQPKGCSRANQLLCSPCSSMRGSASCSPQPVQGKVRRNVQISPEGFVSLSTSSTGSLRRETSALNSVRVLSIATFISDTGFVMPARKNRGVMNHWNE